MRITMIFLLFLFVSGWLSLRLLAPKHPPGGVAALPLPPLEKARGQTYQTATFALG